ncbi:hypothetical protein DFH09DRAFT_1312865 [Mycena vulgaris]|nr:hypothetical protein DFH09DRAFT_1312865 [Mycena vulgaris]
MAPAPWANKDQTRYLRGWMGDYISRQGEGKLPHFWPALHEDWFSRWPEHAALGLPLPSDRTARPLTQDELVVLGASIVMKKGRLENWFWYNRKKIGNATAPAIGPASIALRAMFKELAPKKCRAHQGIEIFQKKYAELIRVELVTAGYGEAQLKADRMRVRTRVVKALWAAASAEVVAEVEADVKREKEEIPEAELDEEKRRANRTSKTPRKFQEGIDIIDPVYSEVHKASYNVSGWVGMTICGGPNPRMGGELSMEIICFGQTLAGNDFEDSYIDFDKNVVQAFEAFLRASYTAKEQAERAFPARPAVVEGPHVTRDEGAIASEPAPKPKKPKCASKKRDQTKTAKEVLATARGVQPSDAALAAASITQSPPTLPPIPQLTVSTPPPTPVNDDFDDNDLGDTSFEMELNNMFPPTPPTPFNPWPAGMPPPPESRDRQRHR